MHRVGGRARPRARLPQGEHQLVGWRGIARGGRGDVPGPGVDVESAPPSGGSTTMSGASMSTPLVAGAAALYLQRHPGATPDEVVAGIVAESTPDKLGSLPGGTPNRLLFLPPKT